MAAARLSASDRHDSFAAWLIIPLAAILTITLMIFYGLFDTTTVEGESMVPTLKPGDKMLVTKSYSQPMRDDIVIVHFRDQRGSEHDVVKRIIGLPGDSVRVKNDVAWINGSIEPAHGGVVDPTTPESFPPVEVPQGRVYIMGDNRIVSLDSRYLGTIPIADIQGRVEAVWAPINRIRRIN